MRHIVAPFFIVFLCNPILFSQSKNPVFKPKFTWTSLTEAQKQSPEKVLHLKLTKRDLNGFPQNIMLFSNLESLSLQGLKLQNLPLEIFDLEELTYLDLSKNKLEQLPEQLNKLEKLEVLIVNRNPVTHLPFDLANLTRLKAIDLYDTETSNLPTTLDGLETLKYVDFQGVQLRNEEMESLIKRFPLVKFFFDPPCNCFNQSRAKYRFQLNTSFFSAL